MSMHEHKTKMKCGILSGRKQYQYVQCASVMVCFSHFRSKSSRFAKLVQAGICSYLTTTVEVLSTYVLELLSVLLPLVKQSLSEIWLFLSLVPRLSTIRSEMCVESLGTRLAGRCFGMQENLLRARYTGTVHMPPHLALLHANCNNPCRPPLQTARPYMHTPLTNTRTCTHVYSYHPPEQANKKAAHTHSV